MRGNEVGVVGGNSQDDLMDFLTKTRIRYQMLVSDADSSGLDD
jgi:hypothetical protein